MRQRFGLGLGGLGKSLCQNLRNPLVILLADALKQRLIRRVLNQGMFEQTHRLGRDAPMIEQLRLDELVQAMLQGSVCTSVAFHPPFYVQWGRLRDGLAVVS
jgi:hypothetical protein